MILDLIISLEKVSSTTFWKRLSLSCDLLKLKFCSFVNYFTEKSFEQHQLKLSGSWKCLHSGNSCGFDRLMWSMRELTKLKIKLLRLWDSHVVQKPHLPVGEVPLHTCAEPRRDLLTRVAYFWHVDCMSSKTLTMMA